MDNIHDIENHDISHIPSKNDVFLKDIDNMINKLNEKRRNSSSNLSNSKNRLSYAYNKNKKSPKFKSSYNFESKNDYNAYHQKFHEYSIRNRVQQNDIHNLKNYYKLYRNSGNYENEDFGSIKIPFYPKNNSNYFLKKKLQKHNPNNRTLYEKENYYKNNKNN
jgi:hypothetical protein